MALPSFAEKLQRVALSTISFAKKQKDAVAIANARSVNINVILNLFIHKYLFPIKVFMNLQFQNLIKIIKKKINYAKTLRNTVSSL